MLPLPLVVVVAHAAGMSCWEEVMEAGDTSSPPVFPLYPTASLPAPLPLGPPEPLLSDRVGTGGDTLRAAAACAGHPWGAISGRELSTGSHEGSNHIPRPTVRQGLLCPHWWTTSDLGVPHLHSCSTLPRDILSWQQEWGQEPCCTPHPHTSAPITKSPGPPPAVVAPQHLRGPAHGWQWGSGLLGA